MNKTVPLNVYFFSSVELVDTRVFLNIYIEFGRINRWRERAREIERMRVRERERDVRSK